MTLLALPDLHRVIFRSLLWTPCNLIMSFYLYADCLDTVITTMHMIALEGIIPPMFDLYSGRLVGIRCVIVASSKMDQAAQVIAIYLSVLR